MAETLLDDAQMRQTLERLSTELVDSLEVTTSLALVGIQRRGVDLAQRLVALLHEKGCQEILCAELDIALYRDDWTMVNSAPRINATHVPFSVEGKTLILVDDVLFTGRTVRSALEAVLDFGRPQAVRLLVLVDRGHRELPIQPDFIGLQVHTEHPQQVSVLIQERDGRDAVLLYPEEG